MSRYYDRAGNQLTFDEWVATFNKDTQRVAYDAYRDHDVSTVWLGLDHNWGGGPPLIFETMIFCHHGAPCDLSEEQWRYSTEAEAEAGHAHALSLVVREEPQ